MIFFAVFMGFIAENIREDYTEHNKAKAYAVNMASDLSADTAALNSYIKYYTYAFTNVDSLMQLLSNNDIKNIPTGKLYLYGLFGGAERPFIPNDATFQQMKSTGGLQFLEKNIARETEQYDQFCRKLTLMQANDHPLYVEVRKLRSQIFEFKYNYIANDIVQYGYLHPVDTIKMAAFVKTNPPLLTYDKSIFNQYVEMVRSRFLDRQVKAADSVLAHATKLLKDVKEEYKVDE